MCSKGGQRVFQAELRAVEVDPIFQKKRSKIQPSQKNVSPTIFEFELPNVNHLLPQSMARSDLNLEAQIRRFLEIHFFLTPQISFSFFGKQGKLRPPVTRPEITSTPLCYTYSEPPGCEDSPGGIQNIPYLYKKLSKSRFSDPFFWRFLVIFELGSRIYIVKSVILIF